MANTAAIRIVKGKQGPHYEDTTEIDLKEVVVTEKGTEADLPMIDLVMTDRDGKQYLLVLTGRIVNGISAVIKGTNLRNHGVEEP